MKMMIVMKMIKTIYLIAVMIVIPRKKLKINFLKWKWNVRIKP